MSDEFEFKEINRVRLQPDDILVLKHPRMLSKAAMEQIKDSLSNVFPSHRCVVLEEGSTLEVLEPSDEDDEQESGGPTLIPLEAHNARIMSNLNRDKLLTGIACPECGGELEDVDNVVMTSFPGQIKCRCTSCDWRGTRLC